MIIDGNALDLVFKGFKTVYTDAYMNAAVHWDKIAMTVPSAGRDETYGWLGQFPQLREWIGPRHVHKLKAHNFKIANRKFESTISIDRDDLSDDRLGIFKPAISEMGHLAKQHPEELIFGLLAAGFTSECFDGQNYFDTDHPQTDSDGAQIYGSKADLTPENYALARAAMMDFRSDGGRILGINPTTLVVPPALESDALHVVNTELTTTGGSNPWKDTAELVVTPFVSA